MISSVRGAVIGLDKDSVVLEVGGIGLRIYTSPATLASLHLGSEAQLYTSLIVKEDELSLYGFADADSRAVFNVLLGVSRIGARTALAMLAVHTPDALRSAIANKDINALTQVSGIGKKGAERIILEIGDKLGPAPQLAAANSPASGAAERDVLEALINLGWPEREAKPACVQAVQENPEAAVADLLRAALQILGKRR